MGTKLLGCAKTPVHCKSVGIAARQNASWVDVSVRASQSLLVGTAPVGRGRLSRFIAPRDFCSGPSIRRFFNLVEAWTVGAFAAENKRIAGALGEPRANKWTLATMPA